MKMVLTFSSQLVYDDCFSPDIPIVASPPEVLEVDGMW